MEWIYLALYLTGSIFYVMNMLGKVKARKTMINALCLSYLCLGLTVVIGAFNK